MSPNRPSASAAVSPGRLRGAGPGFTLVELLIGMSLALILIIAVLSSYVFLGRSFSRTLGVGMANQPTLEAQGRRTLETFALDVEMTAAISNPTASEITLTVPHSTGGTQDVTYYYNSTAAPVAIYGVTVAAHALARIDRSSSTAKTLHSNLLTCSFTYYDVSANPYTTFVNYLPGIKQISLALTAQGGSSTNNTLTQVYTVASPRLLFRNKNLLP